MKTIERAARSVGIDIARHVGHIDTATTAEYVRSLGNRPVGTARRAAELLDPTVGA